MASLIELRLDSSSRPSTPCTYDSDGSEPMQRVVRTNHFTPYHLQVNVLPETVKEWEWPPDSGQRCLLQEHVAEYLQTRNFHRRYPDIHRHSVGYEERSAMHAAGIVISESAFALTALNSEEVLDIMSEDYPGKYRALLGVFQKRELEHQVERVREEADEADEEASEKVGTSLWEVLVEDTQEFNKRLRLSRPNKFESNGIEYTPRNCQYIAPRNATRRGRYPVALLPGQYTDRAVELSSETLYTLPLNTALLHSERPAPRAPPPLNGCESCNQPVKRDGVRCSKCGGSHHRACVSVSVNMAPVIASYCWECPACKSCSVCDQTNGEEYMMFCDICDRGYHTYCVNMGEAPHGRWECRLCVACACCGADTPGEGNWRFQHTKTRQFLQTMCYPCSTWWDKGWFCPVCLKVFDYDAADNPMVCCDFCDRWIHTVCDGIDEEQYAALGESGSLYKCSLCREERVERCDAGHKKYRAPSPTKPQEVPCSFTN